MRFLFLPNNFLNEECLVDFVKLSINEYFELISGLSSNTYVKAA